MTAAPTDLTVREPTRRAGRHRSPATTPARRLTRSLRPHWPLLVVLVPAAVLRVLVLVVYRPALLFWHDSYEYLGAAHRLRPPAERTLGYPLLLRLIDIVGPIGLVPVVQHLLGVGLGIGVYAVLRRRGLPATWGAVAAAPVLLDGYQLDIEQFVLSETLFSVLLLLALGLPLIWRTVSVRRAVLLGLVVSALVLTRSVAIPLVLVLGGYLVLRRIGWRSLAGYAAAVAVPLLGYALWFSAVHGSFGLQLLTGRLLYGKTAQFADCARLPADQQQLCPRIPPDRRLGQDYWSFTPQSPQHLYPYTRAGDQTLGRFARAVIVRQPRTYAHIVAADLYHYAGPRRIARPRDQWLIAWRFPDGRTPNFTVAIADRPYGLKGGVRIPITGRGPRFLHDYQVVSLPGLGLVLCGAVCAAGALRRPRRDPGNAGGADVSADMGADVTADGRGARLDCVLLAVVGALLVVVPAFTVALDYRFLLPDLVVLPMGAALAVARLRGTLH